LLSVMVGYETFAGRVCELAGGTVVAPGTVAGLLADGETLIERVVFDGPNRIVDISSARSFRGILRRVLELTHRRCTHPSCHVPAHRCQGDHIVAWSHGGLTTQHNGQLQCGPHNRWRHTHPHDAGVEPPTPGDAHPPKPARADGQAPRATGSRLPDVPAR
ncbi:MAG TPA: HNH endonuclease signature motif containing protein, partial [Acidimicrobiales bacterium]